MKLTIAVVSLALLASLTCGMPLFTPADFTHHVSLPAPHACDLYWSVLPTAKVEFGLVAHTTGWLGLGISNDGSMASADIVIGGILDDATTYFSDRHGDLFNGFPEADVKQDWMLTGASEDNMHTYIKFERNVNTCDDAQDKVLATGTVKIIYAYTNNGSEPDAAMTKASFSIHDFRASADVDLMIPASLTNDCSSSGGNGTTTPSNGTSSTASGMGTAPTFDLHSGKNSATGAVIIALIVFVIFTIGFVGGVFYTAAPKPAVDENAAELERRRSEFMDRVTSDRTRSSMA